jgi:transcriptional regulator with GAF, ATPase, and Fis domain
MMAKAWLHFLSDFDNGLKSKVEKALMHAGIDLHILDDELPSRPGVIFFDEVTEELYSSVRTFSRGGLERVLAVGASGSAFAGDTAWQLLRAGASDAFAWDDALDPAALVATRLKRWNEVDEILLSPLVQNNLVGKNLNFISKLRQIIEIARFTDASVLITGETGTGKELVAKLIHTLDPRPNKGDLVVLDCTIIVPELSGSEFFGHKRGAFTGAIASREGAFAMADGGTLFLDEVGDLPLDLQAQLLRVIQEHKYKAVGSNTWKSTDFRLVCATNKDLQRAVRRGEFRADLYYRIASWVCKLPPLHERIDDIPLLARHFVKELRSNEDSPELDDTILKYLFERKYPGNIRDLKQMVSRIVYRHLGPGPITIGSIPIDERPAVELGKTDWQDASFEKAITYALALGAGLKEIGKAAEDKAFEIAYSSEDGDLKKVAKRLNLGVRAVQKRRADRLENLKLMEPDENSL